eukprot:TRINITY_DN76934_c0_g1_i1.p1 TRINITY_DN76934_c0_g1~~TRINITY_DN76934_c0_g1_i1.p1  ORF type:complete len:539 (+),score=66.34 TRINITY_DN76934_c0_g1_i1:103-1719(+)
MMACSRVAPTQAPSGTAWAPPSASTADHFANEEQPARHTASSPTSRDQTDGPPSELSLFFGSLCRMRDPEARANGSLKDVVDSVCRSKHQASQKYKPFVPALLRGLSSADRQEKLVWIQQAYEAMHFNDILLFDTSLTLDRHYACVTGVESRMTAQCKLLAAVGLSLKTRAPAEAQIPFRNLVANLGRNALAFEDVLAAELAIVESLGYMVGTPSPQDLLESLGTRVRAPRVCSLAEFLLQLTLVDVSLHYRYPHTVLAAGCLILSLYALGAPSAAHLAVLEDLAVYCSTDAVQTNKATAAMMSKTGLLQCCGALHSHWVQSASPQNQNKYTQQVIKKFSGPRHNTVSDTAPPALPPMSLPTPAVGVRSPGVAGAGLPQDEVEEAIATVRQSLADSPADSGPDVRRHGRCSRCGRTHLFTDDVCACGATLDSPDELSADWAAELAARLQRLAESSTSVRSVLLGFGWNGSRFRRSPDREALLRDLIRVRNGCHKVRVQRPPSATVSLISRAGGMGSRSASAFSRARQRRPYSSGRSPP